MNNIMLRNKPSHWQVAKLAQYFEQRNEKVSDEDYAPLSVTYGGIVPQMEHVAKSNDRDNRKRVAAGDLVINTRSDRRGASGLSDYDGSVSLISLVLKPRLGNRRFFHYLLKSIAFQEEFYRYGHGIVADLWTTGYTELKNILVALPDDETQNRIAAFLDQRCERIDHLIERKRKLLSELKQKEHIAIDGSLTHAHGKGKPFKETGLPWIPKMPANWQMIRAKYLFRNVSRAPLDDDKIITAFRDGQVTLRENRRTEGYTFAVKEVGYQHIMRGDLVIHTMDAFAGAIGVSDSEGKSTGEYAVCEAITDNVNNYYYAQVLRCMAERNYIYVLCPSVRERAPRFRFSKFAPVYMPVPPRPEQDEIAAFLQRARKLRDKTDMSLNLLKSYRASLITEAVTGQLDIQRSAGQGADDKRLDQIAKVLAS
jgi:type I restriction enzyme, S subunit